MRYAVLVMLLSLLGGCSNIHHVKTGHFTKDEDGVTYERQYWIIQTEPKCVGSCLVSKPQSWHP